MLIRVEIPVDAAAIDTLLGDVFAGGNMARVLRCLREDGLLTLGLVAACDDGLPVGYLAFCPVTLAGEDRQWVALSTLAVARDWRGQGIARQLIEEGLNILNEFGYQAVLVTGESDFYARFGFESAARHGLHCQQPPGAGELLVRQLADNTCGVTGQVDYPQHFTGC